MGQTNRPYTQALSQRGKLITAMLRRVLPGCPSPTDSEVNKKQSSSMRELWKPFISPFIVVKGRLVMFANN